jgi:hypothetical protein
LKRFGTSKNEIMDQFITENKGLMWIPYDKFNDIKYLDKGELTTIYKAKYEDEEIILKRYNYLSDENLNEFLNKV